MKEIQLKDLNKNIYFLNFNNGILINNNKEIKLNSNNFNLYNNNILKKNNEYENKNDNKNINYINFIRQIINDILCYTYNYEKDKYNELIDILKNNYYYYENNDIINYKCKIKLDNNIFNIISSLNLNCKIKYKILKYENEIIDFYDYGNYNNDIEEFITINNNIIQSLNIFGLKLFYINNNIFNKVNLIEDYIIINCSNSSIN